MHDQRPRQCHTFPHATAELIRKLAFHALQADTFEHFCDCVRDLGRRHTGLFPQWKGHVIFHGQRIKEGPALKEHTEALPDTRQATTPALMDVLPIHQDLSTIGPYEPDEMLEEHALTCTAAPNDRQNLAMPDIEAQAIKHHLAAKTFTEIAHLDDRHLRHHSSTEFKK